jgi:putative MATE family efflux protein
MSVHPRQYDAARDLTRGSLEWNLFRLAGPVAAGMALQALYSLVDLFWLGKWSSAAVAAQSVSVPFFAVVLSLVMSFAVAGTSVVAQYTGAGRHEEADKAAAQMFLLLAVFSVVLTVPLVVFAEGALKLARAPEETMVPAAAYMRIAMVGMPFIAFSSGYGGALRALGNTTTIVLISIASNVLNAVLDPFFIFGLLGLPAMGVSGAATATVIANIANSAICYKCLQGGHMGLRIRLADLRPDRAMVRDFLRIGLPWAINSSSDSWGFFGYRVLINMLGATVVTAYTTGFRVMNFVTLPASAMAAAASPIVGQALGAGRPKLARRAVWISTALAAGILLPPMLAMVVFGQEITRFFCNDPAVTKEAGQFFMVVPFSAYCFQVLMVLSAAFVGSGHTRPPMAISLIRQWALRIPAGALLGYGLHMGSLGIYLGMVISNVLGAALTLWVFLRGRWQTATVSGLSGRAPGEYAAGEGAGAKA